MFNKKNTRQYKTIMFHTWFVLSFLKKIMKKTTGNRKEYFRIKTKRLSIILDLYPNIENL